MSSAFGTPDLVTLNAGGDDFDAFGDIARKCMFDFGRYDDAACNASITNAESVYRNNLPARIDTLFKAIYNKQPRPTVVVMSYVQFWANIDSKDCAWPLDNASRAYKKRMNDLVVLINTILSKLSAKYGFKFANVDGAFEGHRVCSSLGKDSFKGSWFQMVPKVGEDTSGELYSEISIAHPTIEGQNLYLQALEKVLGCL